MIYPAGKHIVIYNTRTKTQKFIFKSMDDEEIVSITHINKPPSCFYAIAFQGSVKSAPFVRIYFNYRKIVNELKHLDLPGGYQITQMAFSSNEKLLFTFAYNSEKEETIISVWLVENGRLLAQLSSISEAKSVVTYCYSKGGVLFLKNGQLVIAKYKKKQDLISERLFQIPLSPSVNPSLRFNSFHIDYRTDLCFFACNLEIEIYVKTTSLQRLNVGQNILQEYSKEKTFIKSMSSINNLLLIGLSGINRIFVYSLGQENYFKYRNNIELPNRGIFIETMHIEIAEDNTCIGVACLRYNSSDKDFIKSLSPVVELYEIDSAILEAINYSTNEAIRPLQENGTLSGQIVDMSICQNRDIVAVLCSDRLLKLFNYRGDEEELASITLMRNGLCLDMHPTGVQMAVGFNEGLKVFFVTGFELKECFENFNKQCRCVRYSARGDLLAASCGGSISIFDPFSMEKLHVLQAHSANIRCLLWRGNDSRLITNCYNGNIFAWNTQTWEKEFEFFPTNKSQAVLAIEYDMELDLMVFSSNDCKLRMMYDKAGIELIVQDSSPFTITSLLIDREQKALYAGCSNGSIRMFLWPLSVVKSVVEFITTPLHQLSITRIVKNPENSMLLTCSDDSSILLCKMHPFADEIGSLNLDQMDGRPLISIKKEVNFGSIEERQNSESDDKDIDNLQDKSDTTSSVLIYEGSLENEDDFDIVEYEEKNLLKLNDLTLSSTSSETRKQEIQKDLDFHIQNLKNEIDEQKEFMEKQHKQIRKDLELEKKNIVKKQKEELALEMEAVDNKHKELVKEGESETFKYDEKVENMGLDHERRLLEVYKEQDQLNEDLLKFLEELNERSIQLNRLHVEELSGLENDANRKIKELREKYQDSLENLHLDEQKFSEVLLQMEEEFREDFKRHQLKLEGELSSFKKRIDELKLSNSKLLKENQRLKDKQAKLDQLIEEATFQNTQIVEEITALRNEEGVLQKRLVEQEKIILSTEDTFKRCRNQNDYLRNQKAANDFMASSLETQEKQLLDYLIVLTNNLRTVHDTLIKEAEASKNMTWNKSQVIAEVQNSKCALTVKEKLFGKILTLITRVVDDISVNIEDHKVDSRTLQDKLLKIITGNKVSKIKKFYQKLVAPTDSQDQQSTEDNKLVPSFRKKPNQNNQKVIHIQNDQDRNDYSDDDSKDSSGEENFEKEENTLKSPLYQNNSGSNATMNEIQNKKYTGGQTGYKKSNMLQTDKLKDQAVMEELQRMRNNFQMKYKESEQKYKHLTQEKDKVIGKIQDVGKELIKRTKNLCTKRYRIFQDLYDQKQISEKVTNEFNLSKLKKPVFQNSNVRLVFGDEQDENKPTLPANLKKKPKAPNTESQKSFKSKGSLFNNHKEAVQLSAQIVYKEALKWTKESKP
jgi:WD40 repeat protein